MNMDFLTQMGLIKKSEVEIQFTSPLVLAYIGDAIYEAFVRTYILGKYKGTVNELHRISTKFVKASAQAQIVHHLEKEWSEEEWNVIKRGRNQKSSTVPKNADLTDYKYATGFEALIGYLYLMEKQERMVEIIKRAIEVIEGEEHL